MSESLLASVRAHLADPEIYFCVDSSWASREQDHRPRLRKEIAKLLDQRGWTLPRHLLEPGTISEKSDVSFSVSHCPLAGGFALLSPERSASVGFDVEVAERVSTEIVSRISHPSEVAQAPDPASLWVAKEATYKALPEDIQPLVASQIEIVGWLTLGQNFYRFNAALKGSQHFGNASGLVVESGSLKMGFFIYPT